jgi:hypothetical protein
LSVDAAIADLNARLKAGHHRCVVERRRTTLCLRTTLPDRDDPSKRRQQRIPLGLNADYSALPEAERKAIELSYQLRTHTFSWGEWDITHAPDALTVDEFRIAARKLYERRFKTETSWEKKWRPALNKIPPSGPMTEAVALRIVRSLPEGSAGRRDTANIISQVCRVTGINFESVQAAGRGYSSANLTPRDIPSDEQIAALYSQIKLPHWRWLYGMCAAYGIRPHEAVAAELDEEGNCIVADDTKTGNRIAWPVPARWTTEFALRELPRPPQGKATIAKVANDYLHDRGPLPWGLYTLRHAYAIRLITRGIPADIGCQLMGHSLEIHTRTYRRWLQKEKLTALRANFTL